MSGELTKCKIISFSHAETSESKKKKVFEFQINPEQYKKTFRIGYADSEPLGNVGTPSEFRLIQPEQLNLEFVIDGTGVVNGDAGFLSGFAGASASFSISAGGISGSASATAGLSAGDGVTSYVTERINELKSVVYDFHGDIHRPPFVKVVWGEDLFEGVLVTLDITYTLFRPDGAPLRAKVNATFMQQVPQTRQELIKDRSSPDLTHVRIKNNSDNILVMTNKIYGNPIFYLEIAKFNGLTNFRNIKNGTPLQFPPFKKKT